MYSIKFDVDQYFKWIDRPYLDLLIEMARWTHRYTNPNI